MRLDTLDDKGRVLSLTALEKAVISLFSTITFAMLAWVTFTTNETSKDLIQIQTAMGYIQKSADAAARDKFTNSQGRELERRIENLEQYHKGRLSAP